MVSRLHPILGVKAITCKSTVLFLFGVVELRIYRVFDITQYVVAWIHQVFLIDVKVVLSTVLSVLRARKFMVL
jgi:hypothetical protein